MTERARDVARKRTARATSKIVNVPPCADRQRRERLEGSDEEWLRWYFPHVFTTPFTPQHRAMIQAIRNAILYGGDQSIAASRGEGKTTIAKLLALRYTLTGQIRFVVLFSATGTLAENSLQSLRDEIETNDRLAADYPEVCVPVRALENTPNRAHYQTVTGHRHDNGQPYEEASSRFTWCGQEIIYPNVPGSPAAQGIIATRGLDAAVRGLQKKSRRPELVLIDDPDTEDTVRSEEQARKLESRIDRGIAGLGGQQRSVARVMLTTLQSLDCCSAWFTDPKLKPAWKGKRFRFLIQVPTRVDLWEEYIALRQENQRAIDDGGNHTDEFARGAHAFYLARREEMDAGAVVANPHRFNGQLLPDGSQLEVSALQHYYNQVARIGPDAVATELDNNPPEQSGPIESGLTAYRVQRQVSGYDRKYVPPGVVKISQGIDVRKNALHFCVHAWRNDGTSFVIDYGVHEVRGTVYGSDDGVDVAIKRAILERLEASAGLIYDSGEAAMGIDLTLVDAGWRTEAVYAATEAAGLGVYPVMGFGKSGGCAGANFSDHQHQTHDRKPGDGWFMTKRGKVWLVAADTDRWKAWLHDRFLTAPGKPGCMQLFGFPGGERMSADEKAHHAFAHHITNEIEVEEIYKGALRRRWKSKSESTHWLDAAYYSCVAASILGIRLYQPVTVSQPIKYSEVQAERRRQRDSTRVARPTGTTAA